MLTEDQEQVLNRAIEQFGCESQLNMVVEECGELIVAISKLRRVGGRKIDDNAKENAIGEVADVIIMAWQAAQILGMDEVRNRIDYKVNRLKGRLNND